MSLPVRRGSDTTPVGTFSGTAQDVPSRKLFDRAPQARNHFKVPRKTSFLGKVAYGVLSLEVGLGVLLLAVGLLRATDFSEEGMPLAALAVGFAFFLIPYTGLAELKKSFRADTQWLFFRMLRRVYGYLTALVPIWAMFYAMS